MREGILKEMWKPAQAIYDQDPSAMGGELWFPYIG